MTLQLLSTIIKFNFMKMKNTIILSFLIVISALGMQGQGIFSSNERDFKVGIGAQMIGSGELYTGKIELELTRKFNRFFSFGGSLSFGHGMRLTNIVVLDVAEQIATTFQWDQNLFYFSPLLSAKSFW